MIAFITLILISRTPFILAYILKVDQIEPLPLSTRPLTSVYLVGIPEQFGE
jgi:hypothetical protein